QILVGGFSQMGFTILATLAAGLAFLGSWRVALFLGFLIALSSTAIVLKVMTDAGEIDAPHGRLATGVLIFQDLCVVPIMLVLPFLAGKAEGGVIGLLIALGKAALVVVGVIIAARTIVPRVLREILQTRSRELVLIAVILIGTLTALGTAAAGRSRRAGPRGRLAGRRSCWRRRGESRDSCPTSWISSFSASRSSRCSSLPSCCRAGRRCWTRSRSWSRSIDCCQGSGPATWRR